MKILVLFLSLALTIFGSSVVSALLIFDGDFELPMVIGGGWNAFNNAFEDEDSPGIDSAVEGLDTLKAFGDFIDTTNYAGVFQDIAVDGMDIKVGDRVVLSGIVGHISGDAISGGNGAYLELAFVDSLNQEFGAFTSTEVTASSATDVYFNLSTVQTNVPVNAMAVRVKAVFRQDADNSSGAGWYDNLSLIATPEPGSGLTFLVGCFGMAFFRRR